MAREPYYSILWCVVYFALVGRASILIDFQVAQPPPAPADAKQCTIQILQRDFAFSFGSAEVVQYTPPTDGVPGSWAAVTLNFTVTSNGTQFDRLGIFTFQNVEIWRTSTPEPTRGDGIIWTYVKDVTRYIPLFANLGGFILQLDNLIQPGLDGVYSTILHATFYASEGNPTAPQLSPCRRWPMTQGMTPLSLPPSILTSLFREILSNYTLGCMPLETETRNVGGWTTKYFNTANQFISSLPPGVALGQGPFREVRLLIDGKVAGVAFPYATIFTGGIIPSAWRCVGYQLLPMVLWTSPPISWTSLPSLPLLVDGKPHTFTLDVVSAEDDHTILQNWFVSGLLQVVTDPSLKQTKGRMTKYSAEPFASTSISGSVGGSGDVNVTVSASRKIEIEAEIKGGSRKVTHVRWEQDLQYSNLQNFLQDTAIQNVFQTASGKALSTHNGIPTVVDTFSYPLNINFTVLTPTGDTFSAVFDHSYNRDLLPAPFMPQSKIMEKQLAIGFFHLSSSGNTGNGTSNNTFSYSDFKGNIFQREVNAALNVITLDQSSGSLAPLSVQRTVSSKQVPAGEFSAVRLPGSRKVVGVT
ncbi:hypothetical protein AX16_003594 [Volvariella volvacea WC 439]|nr:hypothetical protein AX16_003594 [Volvariella volvacea WC 439]